MSKVKKSTEIKIFKENKYIVWAVLGVFLVMTFVLSTYKVEDDDFYWHLSTGRYIYENHTVPGSDVFSYSTNNSEWIPFEWGWDILIYSLNLIGGVKLIFVFNSIIFCTIFYFHFRLLQKFKVNTFLSVLLLSVLLFAIFNRLSARPHSITYLFLTLLLYFIVSLKYLNREKYINKIYFIPVIFLVWGNMHLGVIAGSLFLFLFVVSEIINFYFPEKYGKNIKPLESKEIKLLVIVFIVSLATLFINPHGVNTYIYGYNHVKMKMLESIAEWQNPFTGQLDGGFVLTLYKVFLLLGSFILVYAFKKKDIFFGLTYIVFVLYSIRAIRFNIDYEIVITFFVAVSINYLINDELKNKENIRKFLAGNIPKFGLIIIFLYIIIQSAYSNNLYLMLHYNRSFGYGINEMFIPYRMIDFMKENNIDGRSYNNYESGGYYLWKFPCVKNFIDSRNINDESFNEYLAILNMQQGFEEKLEKYGINVIQYYEPKLTRYPDLMKNQIASYASQNSKWKLVYWDDMSMLFLKDIPENAELIKKYEYKVLIPFKAVFRQKDFEYDVRNLYEVTQREMQRKENEEPNGYYFSGMKANIRDVLNK